MREVKMALVSMDEAVAVWKCEEALFNKPISYTQPSQANIKQVAFQTIGDVDVVRHERCGDGWLIYYTEEDK